jgi:hypothetical protein
MSFWIAISIEHCHCAKLGGFSILLFMGSGKHMKRPTKPFIVEVRKGAKSKSPQEALSKDQSPQPAAHALAERKLFQSPALRPAKPERPEGRRILQSLDLSAPEPLLIEEPPRRRGRPPGSRNKVGTERLAPAIPRKRGRPRRIPEGEVRQVPLTSDLASDLLARLGLTATTQAEQPAAEAPPAQPARAVPSPLAPATATEGLRMGERWKRRLRGPARKAFERRHAKV